MKKLGLILALLLLVASPSSAIIFFDVDGDFIRLGGGGGANSWTFVQAQTDSVSGTSLTSTAISTTTGNLIVVAGGSAGQTMNAPTDSGSHTWTACPGEGTLTGAGSRRLLYYAANITGSASHTFTISVPVADDLTIVVMEFTDTNTSVCDQSAGGGETGTVTAHSSDATSTTTAANELLACVMTTSDSFGATVTGTNGWTVPTNGYVNVGGTDVAGLYKTVSSTGAYDCTATSATASRSAMAIGTFK